MSADLRSFPATSSTAAPLPSCYSVDALQSLSKSELVSLVLQYQAVVQPHVASNYPVSHSSSASIDASSAAKSSRFKSNSKKRPAAIAFSRFEIRNVCLELCYLGDDFQGWAKQSTTSSSSPSHSSAEPRTVEGTLLSALKSAALIESCNFAFHHLQVSGRTDSGVHAKQQYVSVWLRSAYEVMNVEHQKKIEKKIGFVPRAYMEKIRSKGRNEKDQKPKEEEDETFFQMVNAVSSSASSSSSSSSSKGAVGSCAYCEESDEFDYLRLINTHLPPDIRILHWSPVPLHFSARFSCQFRSYRYLFPQRAGVDVGAMAVASSYLKGVHSFEKFCKSGKGKSGKEKVKEKAKENEREKEKEKKAEVEQKDLTFYRLVDNSAIRPLGLGKGDADNSWYEYYCSANSFLTHQMRITMNYLFQIASGKHAPEAISELLVDDGRPRTSTTSALYMELAPPNALVLDGCDFQSERTISALKACTNDNIAQLPSWLISSLIAASNVASTPSSSTLAETPLSAISALALSPPPQISFPFFQPPPTVASAGGSTTPSLSASHVCLPRWSASYVRLQEHFEQLLLQHRVRLRVLRMFLEEIEQRRQSLQAYTSMSFAQAIPDNQLLQPK